ncbi:MAG: ClpXP protease specificity-enhancing factor [Lautropia sp.]|nr:MAG: ClpXP protease specificity-enhancing factor [Pseudomonadota bacterium]MBC6960771.1 ClpXP protease specificity-enhancing factor [Lautropia sp.]MCL4703428.1 ClpXP protease specificity-enhancing factor [Burkholderiaceae bacterium]MDL1908745.1 ClpXP protease specificity-enhancing factor [Betaproteobacteria bacterium PRO1]RIK87685.1 MAG: ClpXP protease specificity-enhancing factor [Burkholderiales bacterium]
MAEISTRPYLIRALYEWCTDNGYRPYIAVAVDERTIVPREFVRNDEIVLNISATATNRLTIGNELLEFEARFSGVARQVSIPIENVSAIFAQETGHGMAFEVPKAPAAAPGHAPAATVEGEPAAADSGAHAPSAEESAGPAAAPAGGRARRRPKLSAVPAPGEEAPRPARRKPQISALPGRKATRDTPAGSEPAAARPASPDSRAPTGATGAADDRGVAPSGGAPREDDPGPGPKPPGRPHLKRVK